MTIANTNSTYSSGRYSKVRANDAALAQYGCARIRLAARIFAAASKSSRIGPQLQTALSFVSQESGLIQPGYVAVASRLMDLLFIQILRAAMLQRIPQIGELAGITDPKLSLGMSAMHCFHSHFAFSRAFRNFTGHTPRAYRKLHQDKDLSA